MVAATRTLRFLSAGMALASVLACGNPSREGLWEATADLSSRLAVARVQSEISLVDFGTSEARSSLHSGWSRDETDNNGLSFVASVGDRSTLSFFLTSTREVRVKFRCRPVPSSSRVQSLSLHLNGAPAGEIALDSRLKTYDLQLPAQHLRAGDNRLSFIYGVDGAKQAGGPFPRVNWFRLQLEGTRPALELPLAEPASEAIFLPYGTQVDLPVITGPGAQFRADRIDVRGGSSARVRIDLLTDTQRLPLAKIDASREQATFDLPASQPDAVLLSLRAESEGAWGTGDGVYLRRPQIHAPVAALRAPTRKGAPGQPHILIYLVDTLRADRLSTYGHERPTSPELDEFAMTATLFEKAIGQSSWTRPSVASIFTGQWPAGHAVVQRRDALSQELETIAETLRRLGYETAGFSANPNVSAAFGFNQGFGFFRLLPEASDSVATNVAVFDWLENRPRERPFFLYVQPADPHGPYLPPEPFRSRLAADARDMYNRIEAAPTKEIWGTDPETVDQLLMLYDAEIAANDASFGSLLDRLTDLALLDDMLVIFLSDHGEEFLDHGGWTHGRTLHAETLDFPLLIKLPGQTEKRRVAEAVEHVDIPATIADLLDIDPPAGSEGRSLLPLVVPPSHADAARPFSTRPTYAHVSLIKGLTTSIVVGEWKLIDRRSRKDNETRLYRWPEDPAETRDLATAFPLRVAALRALLDEKLASPQARRDAEEATLDPDLEQRLRALGYL